LEVRIHEKPGPELTLAYIMLKNNAENTMPHWLNQDRIFHYYYYFSLKPETDHSLVALPGLYARYGFTIPADNPEKPASGQTKIHKGCAQRNKTTGVAG